MMWGPRGRWVMYGGQGWGLALLMGLMMLAVLGLLVVILVIVLRRPHALRRSEGHPEDRDESRRILDRRFASGEIDEEEWRARSDALRRPPPG